MLYHAASPPLVYIPLNIYGLAVLTTTLANSHSLGYRVAYLTILRITVLVCYLKFT